MHRMAFALTAFLALSATAGATTFRFDTDPFFGSTAPTTPGRQVVGGEPFIIFDPATDVFEFELGAFSPYGFGPNIAFANDVIGNIPNSANFVVLRTFDNDANPATPFAAGSAADLIANQVTTSKAGFFVYFNSGLDLARLVFSTNLDDNTADLKIMARMTNLTGQSGRDLLEKFTPANVRVTNEVPEPSSVTLLTVGAFALLLRRGKQTLP